MQQHRSLLGLEPIDHVAARQDMGASGQLVRTPDPDDRVIFTARTPGVPQVCDAATGLASPSAKSLIILTVRLPVQSAAQGEHPVIGIVQHAGSAKPSTLRGGIGSSVGGSQTFAEDLGGLVTSMREPTRATL